MAKVVGRWWADREIELVEINREVYALYGWNGKKWTKCWKCTGEYFMDASEETYSVTPVGDDDGISGYYVS